MRALRSIAVLCAALTFASPACAGWSNSGWWRMGWSKPPAAAAGYTGPGDIVSGAKAWYGLRAYSAAVAATGTQKAVNLSRASDSHTCDVLIATSGDLGNTANCSTGGENGTAAATWCNATTCSVVTWYDQSGNSGNDASGVSSPTITFGCVNSKACIVLNGTTQYFSTTATSTSQQLSVSAVATRTSGTGQQNILSDPPGNGLVFFANGGSFLAGSYFGASAFNAGTNDTNWHAFQWTINAASSSINIDGTQTTGNPGSNGIGANMRIGRENGGSFLNGKLTEVGLWPSGFTGTQQNNICHNQYAYFGTSTSC